MTSLAVAQTFCAISFMFMIVSWTRAFWIMHRQAKQESSDPHVTRSEVYEIVRSELKPIVEEAISKALGAKEQ
ncbi:MAG: hypothetical protein IJR63_02050 [Synergistaceae bacterium]|nr:hypothetical protein [Synergistaceae bacterium]